MMFFSSSKKTAVEEEEEEETAADEVHQQEEPQGANADVTTKKTKKTKTTTATAKVPVGMSNMKKKFVEEEAQFSSSECPPGPGLDKTGEVPFGFVWSPLKASIPSCCTLATTTTTTAQEDKKEDKKEDKEDDMIPILHLPAAATATATAMLKEEQEKENETDENKDTQNVKKQQKRQDQEAQVQLPPMICLQCLSYMNKYCTFQLDDEDAKKKKKSAANTTATWDCSLCGHTNAIPASDVQALLHAKRVYRFKKRQKLLQLEQEQQMKMDRTASTATIPEETEEELDESTVDPTHWATICASRSPVYEIRQHLFAPTQVQSHCNLIVVLDEHLSTMDLHVIGQALQSMLLDNNSSMLYHQVHVGLVVFGKNASIYQLGTGAAGEDKDEDSVPPPLSCDVFATPEALTARHVRERQYLLPLILAGDEKKGSSHKKRFRRFWDSLVAHFGTAVLQDPEQQQAAATSSTSTSMSRMDMLKHKKQARMKREQQQQDPAASKDKQDDDDDDTLLMDEDWMTDEETSPWIKANYWMQHRQQRPLRCTGEAVQCAMVLAKYAAKTAKTAATDSAPTVVHRGRVLLFTNGCPNFGEGTVVAAADEEDEEEETGGKKDLIGKSSAAFHHHAADIVDPLEYSKACPYFDAVGRTAVLQGTAIDILCSGHGELALPAYQALAEPSSGYVLLLSSQQPRGSGGYLSLEQVEHNLEFLWNSNYIPKAATPPKTTKKSSSSTGDASGPPPMWVQGCILDIRTPSYVDPSHLVGPGELVDDIAPAGTIANPAYTTLPKTNTQKKNINIQKGILQNELAAFHKGCEYAALRKIRTHRLPNKDMLENNCTRIQLGRCDPLSTVSVMLRLNSKFDKIYQKQLQEYQKLQKQQGNNNSSMNAPPTSLAAVFQCILRYMEPDGCTLVTRVSTHCLDVASSVSSYMTTVHSRVVQVLLAKEAVYRSMFGREVDHTTTGDGLRDGNAAVANVPFEQDELERLAFEAQRDLDATIHCISTATHLRRLEEQAEGESVSKETGSSVTDFAFPSELRDGLLRLYHLRRGPLLSPGPLQSMDDRAEIRSLFIRLPLEESIQMMAPSLWSSGVLTNQDKRKKPRMDVVPPETLALWDNCILAGDYYHTQFIWSGQAVSDASFQVARDHFHDFLQERALSRFPMPKIHVLQERESMSRRFTALLAPSHGDPVEHQQSNFPALSQELSEEEQAALRNKFQFYDAQADPSFRTWFWDVASTTSASKDEGISLCD